MSTPAALRELDAQIHAAFKDTGFADEGFYTAPGANVDVPVQCYINRNVQVLGEFGQVVDRRDEMQILIADGVDIKPAGIVLVEETVGAGVGTNWKLGKKLGDDGGISTWTVHRV